MIALLSSLLDDRPGEIDAVREAVRTMLDPTFRGRLTEIGAEVGRCLAVTAVQAFADDRPRDVERFSAAALRCRAALAEYVRRLGFLGDARLRSGDPAGAVRAACQALRLAQAYSVQEEGMALGQLASSARAVDAPAAPVLAVLAEQRLAPDTAHAGALRREFGLLLAQIGGGARQRVEREYRADRGAALLREAFAVDVDEVDALNERLGSADEDELRGFLLDLREYCSPSAAQADPLR